MAVCLFDSSFQSEDKTQQWHAEANSFQRDSFFERAGVAQALYPVLVDASLDQLSCIFGNA